MKARLKLENSQKFLDALASLDVALVCLSVCLSVCLLTKLKIWVKSHDFKSRPQVKISHHNLFLGVPYWHCLKILIYGSQRKVSHCECQRIQGVLAHLFSKDTDRFVIQFHWLVTQFCAGGQ